MTEEERLRLNIHLEALFQAMQVGEIILDSEHSGELYSLINKLLEENKKLKKENEKLREKLDKIKKCCDKVPYDWSVCGIHVVQKIEKILKGEGENV